MFHSSDTVINMNAQIILFIIGGSQIINGNLTIGVFTILSTYFNNIVKSTKYFINLGTEYINNSISAKRIQDLLNITEQNNGNISIDLLYNIMLNDITF